MALPGLRLTAQESSEDIPYIYYYDNDLYVFVIERANGEDRHVLGEGLMPTASENPLEFHVDGPGWSPSGEWFAWTATDNWGFESIPTYRPYVVHAADNVPFTGLDALEDVELAWSPNEDLLLVGAQHENEARTDIHRYAALVNPATGEIHPALDQTSPLTDPEPYGPSVDRPIVHWIQDGAYGVVEIIQRDGEQASRPIYLFAPDGSFTERQFPALLTATSEYWISSVAVSTSGKVAYPTEAGLTVEDLISGEVQQFDLKVDALTNFLWSPDGQRALLWGEGQFSLYTGDDLITLSTEVIPGWPDFYPNAAYWSPDGTHALISDGVTTVYHVNAAQGTLEALSETAAYDVNWYWLDGHTAAIQFQAETAEEAHPLIALVDFEADTTTQLETRGFSYAAFRFSPDRSQFAYVMDGPVLYDLESQTYQDIRPSYEGYNSLLGGEVEWHPDGEWLFVYEDALVAGGGTLRDLGVVRADGSEYHDLSWQPDPNRVALDWLPPQVDLAALESLRSPEQEPVPVKVLYGTTWSFYLDWSPDGTRLARGMEYWGFEGGISYWDLATGTKQDVLRNMTEGQQIVWAEEESGFVPDAATSIEIPQGAPAGIPLSVSDDGARLVIADETGVPTVVEASSGEVIYSFADPEYLYEPVSSADFSPDGRWLAIGFPYRNGLIVDTSTWQVVYEMPHLTPGVAFSPDGTQLATSASWEVLIWDVADLVSP
jgi:WD40 repeat protein